MSCSRKLQATRAFVVVLLSLAKAYNLIVSVNRDSCNVELQRAYRRVVLRAHPDKGGKKEDAQRLQEARATWQQAQNAPDDRRGRPSSEATEGGSVVSTVAKKGWAKEGFRVKSQAVLLTHHGIKNKKQVLKLEPFLQPTTISRLNP